MVFSFVFMSDHPCQRESKEETTVRYCRACGRETKRLSGSCGKCERNKRENGHPAQRAVTKRELSEHLKLVLKCRKRTASQATEWAALDAQWGHIVDHARAVVAESRSGRAYLSTELRAANEVLRLARDVEAQQVTDVSLAMWSLNLNDGRMLKDDHSFLVQWVRQVRKLGTVALGQRWDDRQQRVRRMYVCVPPSAVKVFAGWLKAAYAHAGVTFARAERERHERELEEKARVKAAIGSLFNGEKDVA